MYLKNIQSLIYVNIQSIHDIQLRKSHQMRRHMWWTMPPAESHKLIANASRLGWCNTAFERPIDNALILVAECMAIGAGIGLARSRKIWWIEAEREAKDDTI